MPPPAENAIRAPWDHPGPAVEPPTTIWPGKYWRLENMPHGQVNTVPEIIAFRSLEVAVFPSEPLTFDEFFGNDFANNAVPSRHFFSTWADGLGPNEETIFGFETSHEPSTNLQTLGAYQSDPATYRFHSFTSAYSSGATTAFTQSPAKPRDARDDFGFDELKIVNSSGQSTAGITRITGIPFFDNGASQNVRYGSFGGGGVGGYRKPVAAGNNIFDDDLNAYGDVYNNGGIDAPFVSFSIENVIQNQAVVDNTLLVARWFYRTIADNNGIAEFTIPDFDPTFWPFTPGEDVFLENL